MLTGNTATWVPPEWARDFCKDYTLFLFGAGKWTLIAGVLLGIALAITTTILLLRKSSSTEQVGAAVTGTAILDAVRAFLQALSSAPTWLALFGAGVLMLWLAGYTRPEICPGPPQPCAQNCPQPTRTATGTTSALSPPAPGNTQ